MDATAQQNEEQASDSDWANEDITVLSTLLATPRNRSSGETKLEPQRQTPSNNNAEEEEEKDEDEDDNNAAEHVAITALRRQVHLLEQEYDRHLELQVAKSVVAAGGRSAPRASTIKLYRQYERLLRVASAIEMENQRLVALLRDRQLQHQQAALRIRQDFRFDEETERIPRDMLEADAKDPETQRPPAREELPRSASE